MFTDDSAWFDFVLKYHAHQGDLGSLISAIMGFRVAFNHAIDIMMLVSLVFVGISLFEAGNYRD